MKFLFIHAHVTLEYFNFKSLKENNLKGLLRIYFYCFSDKCSCRETAGGGMKHRNKSDPHLNKHIREHI